MDLINKIGIGSVQFGVDYGISNADGVTNIAEVKQILKLARANKIDYIDTAFAYGNAEEVLGKTVENNFKIISKFISPTKDQSLLYQFNKSLSRLKVESLYGYLAHRPLDILNDETIWIELSKLKSDNKINKIGFSFNTIDEMNQMLDKGFLPDIVQVPFNYFDNRFENAMKALKKNGCEIHTRSTFLQGLFFCNPMELSPFFNSIKPILIDLQNKHQELAGALLHYSTEKEYIDKVIIGVNNKEQLQQNINSLGSITHFLKPLKREISEKIKTPSMWPKS